MAEYIARKEANEWVADWLREDRSWHPYSKGKNIPTIEVFDILARIPAADVQPVVHGRWSGDFCSNCGVSKYNFISFNIVGEKEYARPFGTWKYCPNCGAKMDDNGSS